MHADLRHFFAVVNLGRLELKMRYRAMSAPKRREFGWVGNINVIPVSDPLNVGIREQFNAGAKSPSMQKFDSFEAWEAHTVSVASSIILNMINSVEPGQKPISREQVIRQVQANQEAVRPHSRQRRTPMK